MIMNGCKAKMWAWRLFVSIIMACSFVIPAGASNEFGAFTNGIWWALVSFYGLRFVYRRFIFKFIFGFAWSKSREDFVNKSKV